MKTITWEEILNVSSDKYKHDVMEFSVSVQYSSSLILKLIEHEYKWIDKSKICLDEGILEECKVNGWYIHIYKNKTIAWSRRGSPKNYIFIGFCECGTRLVSIKAINSYISYCPNCLK